MTTRSDFWARRKARVAEEEAQTEKAALAAQEAKAEQALEEKTDEEICAELGLPDPDSLSLGDDVKAFMQSGVPARLRKRALRRLWRTNPVLANLDGLAEYNEDYTDAATVIDDLKTTYQVGKGLLRHIEYEAEKRARAEAAAEQDTTLSEAEETDEIPQENQDAAPASATKVVVAEPDVSDETDETEISPRPRRMTFTFTTEST